jgi:hypothetical protein
MDNSENTEPINFRTTKKQKKLAKILAAKMDKEDVTSLMQYILQREIDRNFSPEIQEMLLAWNDESGATKEKEEQVDPTGVYDESDAFVRGVQGKRPKEPRGTPPDQETPQQKRASGGRKGG